MQLYPKLAGKAALVKQFVYFTRNWSGLLTALQPCVKLFLSTGVEVQNDVRHRDPHQEPEIYQQGLVFWFLFLLRGPKGGSELTFCQVSEQAGRMVWMNSRHGSPLGEN